MSLPEACLVAPVSMTPPVCGLNSDEDWILAAPNLRSRSTVGLPDRGVCIAAGCNDAAKHPMVSSLPTKPVRGSVHMAAVATMSRAAALAKYSTLAPPSCEGARHTEPIETGRQRQIRNPHQRRGMMPHAQQTGRACPHDHRRSSIHCLNHRQPKNITSALCFLAVECQ